MIDVLNDLEKLTTIPKEKFNKLVDKINLIILDALAESTDKVIDLDIGIGTLQLVNDENLTYRFIPSKSLEKAIIKYFDSGVNPLQDTLEKTLAERIINVYKDII